MAGSSLSPGSKYGLRAAEPAILFLLSLILLGCVRPGPREEDPSQPAGFSAQSQTTLSELAPSAGDTAKTNLPGDQPQAAAAQHTVLLGETLSTIAEQYGTDVATLMALNEIEDGNLLLPGQVLQIPGPSTAPPPAQAVAAADFDIISDHELVYGPTAKDFDLNSFLNNFDGYLLAYEEEVEGRVLDGPAVIQLVADRYSINPKLLLAVLEFQAGWLTEKQPAELEYLLGYELEGLEGLYKQLSWAANMLNWGFYGHSGGGMTAITVDGTAVPFAAGISDGTAGVQLYLSARDEITYEDWLRDSSPDGFAATYRSLFGRLDESGQTPLFPDGLEQPFLLLPWERGEVWHFSGGPHGGWNSGSAWAALDFVPPDVDFGCAPSNSWVTAAADGVIARSGFGAVVLDLDGDGYAGTGWAITYMHLDDRQRIAEGASVKAGERLGHPGCEGGFTNGTHLHIARTYNGSWIAADGAVPFNFEGWISSGIGNEYDGWLTKNGTSKAADVYATEDNAIAAE